MIRPQMIRLIRLMLFHFLIKFFIAFLAGFFWIPHPSLLFFAFRKHDYDYTGKKQESKYYFWYKMTRKKKKYVKNLSY